MRRRRRVSQGRIGAASSRGGRRGRGPLRGSESGALEVALFRVKRRNEARRRLDKARRRQRVGRYDKGARLALLQALRPGVGRSNRNLKNGWIVWHDTKCAIADELKYNTRWSHPDVGSAGAIRRREGSTVRERLNVQNLRRLLDVGAPEVSRAVAERETARNDYGWNRE